jgi:GH24 family phage-related lysozyme (muramidase)
MTPKQAPQPWVDVLPEFEGCVPWMYLDGGGNVTCGVGCMLPSSESAVEVYDDPEAANDWEYVSTLEPGYAADFYQSGTKCRLTQEQIDGQLADDQNAATEKLRDSAPDSTSWPECVQDACRDIIFNTGNIDGFPSMLAAIRAGDWDTAADESHRKQVPDPGGIPQSRNDWTRDSILWAKEERADL